MHSNHFLLHLTLIDDIGPATIQKIIERSDFNESDLYSFSVINWMQIFGFSEKTAEKLFIGLNNKKIVEQELELIEKHQVKWVTITNESYPSLLKEIHLPPVVLYWQGSGFNITKSLAVVGSRKATAYGKQAIDTIIPDLVTSGYTIVSGGALGIDTLAHQSALEHGGKTIAVLGSGLLRPYPSANKKLFAAIIENNGAVVSSYPLTMGPLQGHFPARNRIVTGLSQGCLVVQAAQKSGALISAHYALEQGREVFAIPGPIYDELSAGCNQLIQQGAKLVMQSSDILQEFGEQIIKKNPSVDSVKTEIQKTIPIAPIKASIQESSYSDIQKKIISACKKPASLEDILEKTELSFETAQSELFNLQLENALSQDFMGMWQVHQ